MSSPPRIVVAGVANLCTAATVTTTAASGTGDRREHTTAMTTGVSGVGANLALILNRLGTRVDLCTLIGQDPPGRAIRAGLEQEGLHGPGCVPTPSSALALCLVDGNGSGYSATYLDDLADALYPTSVFTDLVQGADLAVLTTIGFTRPLIAHAHRAGVPIAVDVHVVADIDHPEQEPWLHSADVVFCSHERLPCPPRAWIRHVFDTYPGCVVAGVGCGDRGAVVGTREGLLVTARTRLPRPLANTIGAGDALFGSFLHGWVAAGNPAQALHDAVLHASWLIGDLFPNHGRLDRDQLRELARTHPVHMTVDRW